METNNCVKYELSPKELFFPSKLVSKPQELAFTDGYCKHLLHISDTCIFAIGDTEGKVTFWNSKTLEKVYSIVPHRGWINHMLYLTASKLLITTSTDQAICVYSLAPELSQSSEKGRIDCNWVIHLLDIEDQGLFGSCSECSVKLWNVDTLNLVGEIRSYSCHFWQYIKSLKTIFFAHDDGTIALYNMKKKKWRRSTPLAIHSISCSTFSLVEYIESKRLLVTLVTGDRLVIWKIDSNKIQYVKHMSIIDLSNSVPCLLDEKYILGSDGDGKLVAFDAFNGKLIKEIELEIDPLMWLFLRQEKKVVIPNIVDNKIYVINYN